VRARARAHFYVDVGVGALSYACACVTLLIQHATRHRMVISGLSGSTILFDITSNGTIFGKKDTEHKFCILIFSTNFT
jgi:hypothetical protein